MAQRPYRLAVIGAGFGGKLSIEAAAASTRYELVAVADLRDEARRAIKQRFPWVHTFSSHQELFESCPVEVVCVSTWPPSHLDVTRDALQLPLKGIVVEKPLATTVAEGREILAAVQARALPMVVPHGLLQLEHVRQLIKQVQTGDIGDLKLLEIQHNGWDLFNAGVHWLNFFVVLTGMEPLDFVMACCDTSTRTHRDGMQVETLAVTYVQTRSGIRLVMNTGDYVKISHPGKNGLFRLVGTQGTIEFYGWEPRYRLLTAGDAGVHLIEFEPAAQTPHQRYLEMLADQMDRSTPDYFVAESSLRALEIIEGAYRSSTYQRAVALPLSPPSAPDPMHWELGKPYTGINGGRDGRNLPVLDAPSVSSATCYDPS